MLEGGDPTEVSYQEQVLTLIVRQPDSRWNADWKADRHGQGVPFEIHLCDLIVVESHKT